MNPISDIVCNLLETSFSRWTDEDKRDVVLRGFLVNVCSHNPFREMTTVEKQFPKKYVYTPVNDKFRSERDNYCAKFEEFCDDSGPLIGTRHVQICLIFIIGFVAFASKVCISMGIVAMMDPLASGNVEIPTYPGWKRKNVILSAFFWGYVMPQVFAAWAAKKYGAKWFLVGTMFIQSILSVLTSLIAANFGEMGIIISRAVEGFCQGFVFPACTHLLSQWVPTQERSRYGSVLYTSGKLGTLFSMYITGLIAASSFGWPWVFRLMGGLGILWCILMSIFGHDSPRQHPKISETERIFIEKSLGYDGRVHRTPWKAMVTSRPVWALFLAQAGKAYCFWTLLTQTPSYLNYVVKYDIKQNGIISSMPYLAMFVLSYVFAFISDAIVNKGIVSRGVARKIFNTIGLVVPAGTLVALGYTTSEQKVQAIALIIISVGVGSASFSGFGINHMDLTPNHAGILMGFCNGASQITGIVAPLVAQLLVVDETDPLQWRYVFFISAGVLVVTAVIFVIFGSAEVQRWNKEEEPKFI